MKCIYFTAIMFFVVPAYAAVPDLCIFQMKTTEFYSELYTPSAGSIYDEVSYSGSDGVPDSNSLNYNGGSAVYETSTVVDEQSICQLIEGILDDGSSSGGHVTSQCYSENEVVSPDGLATLVTLKVTISYSSLSSHPGTESYGFVEFNGNSSYYDFDPSSGVIMDFNGTAHYPYVGSSGASTVMSDSVVMYMDDVPVGTIVRLYRYTEFSGGPYQEITTSDLKVEIVDSY